MGKVISVVEDGVLSIWLGDALEVLRSLSDESVDCCVTSPPYWGLRDYGVTGQLGLEKTLEEYVAKMVMIFREVKRVLKKEGTLWLNLGDSYASSNATTGGYSNKSTPQGYTSEHTKGREMNRNEKSFPLQHGLKPKDLCGIPWRVAFALQADGWWLRSDIIWAKPNPMPESVTDRPTRAHEYVFLLSKSARYFYDAAAIRSAPAESTLADKRYWDEDYQTGRPERDYPGQAQHGSGLLKRKDYGGNGVQDPVSVRDRIIDKKRAKVSQEEQMALGSNKRSVWSIATMPYKEAHFATFPPKLVEPCVRAGCPVGGVVLDPFAGSGTVGEVALAEGRRAQLIELNGEYMDLIRKRCCNSQLGLEIEN